MKKKQKETAAASVIDDLFASAESKRNKKLKRKNKTAQEGNPSPSQAPQREEVKKSKIDLDQLFREVNESQSTLQHSDFYKRLRIAPSPLETDRPNTNAPHSSTEILKSMMAPSLHQHVDQLQGKSFLLDSYKKDPAEITLQAVGTSKHKKSIKPQKSFATASHKKEELNYSDVVIMNEMWRAYVAGLLFGAKGGRLDDAQAHLAKLLKADFHGARICVVKSSNKALVGLQGIVLKEGARSFQIVSEDNRQRLLLKHQCVFAVELDKGQFLRINGPQFLHKGSNRTKAKFKDRS